ncbi:MAG TPA: glycosyltransferase family 39 protein [Phycisphaerae bacterium]|nr:glycosyltransferase family 39 protein [Phycisphaerae bacterium]
MIATDAHGPLAPSVAPTSGPTPSARLAVGVIVLLGAALRLIALDRVPPAIGQDEAVNAYDAYCILKTGTDHYGTPWPIFFRSFGDYHPGLPIYLQIPFQAVLGINIWSTRLPDALFGIAHIVFTYLLVRMFYGQRSAFWAAALLAVSPWHIHLSRLAFGIAIALCLITLGIYLVASRMRGGAGDSPVNRGTMLALAGAGLAFGVTPWTYHAMIVFVPLLLFAAVLIGWRRIHAFMKRRGSRAALSALFIGFCIGVAPFAWASIRTPEQVWTRASSQSLFRQAPDAMSAAQQVAANYFRHFSPSFLFLEGDRSLMQSVSRYGQLHHLYALLLPLGLVRVIGRWRQERFGRFIICWIVLAPIPAALTQIGESSGHCLRAAGAVPAYDILAALGIGVLLDAACRLWPPVLGSARAAALSVVVASAAHFGYHFFVRYPVEAAHDFLAEWGPAFQEVARIESHYDAVMITEFGSGNAGVFYLFWSATDPATFLHSDPRYQPIESGDYLVQFGKFYFVSSEQLDQVARRLPPRARVLVVERPDIAVPGRPVARFDDAYGNLSIVLFEVAF